MSRAKVCAVYSLYTGVSSLCTVNTETSGAGGATAALDTLGPGLQAATASDAKTKANVKNREYVPAKITKCSFPATVMRERRPTKQSRQLPILQT